MKEHKKRYSSNQNQTKDSLIDFLKKDFDNSGMSLNKYSVTYSLNISTLHTAFYGKKKISSDLLFAYLSQVGYDIGLILTKKD